MCEKGVREEARAQAKADTAQTGACKLDQMQTTLNYQDAKGSALQCGNWCGTCKRN